MVRCEKRVTRSKKARRSKTIGERGPLGRKGQTIVLKEAMTRWTLEDQKRRKGKGETPNAGKGSLF